MRIFSKLNDKGLVLVLLPFLSQVAFAIIVWLVWSNPASTAAAQEALQRKLLISAIMYSVLLAATLYLFFHETVAEEAKRLAANVSRISEGNEYLEELKTEEFSAVEARFKELEMALKLAMVAAHEGKESKSAEMKLRLNEERVRLIVDSMPVGLAVVDTRGNIESLNPAAQRMFLVGSGDTMNAHFSALFPATADGGIDNIAELAALQSSKPRELNCKRKDGTRFTAELTVKSFEAIEGNRYLVLILDVTERHEIERLKQEFVAIVSHELRTPLTSVGAFLDMLLLGAFDADAIAMKSRAEMANRNVLRLVGLVNNLLDLEKMESGRFEFRVTEVSADSIMVRSIESVSEFAQQHKVLLECVPCPVRFDGDEERLIQVLINLLSNAIKFSNPGESVKVFAEEQGDWIQISVEDTGAGVPPDCESMIFEKYRQASQPGGSRHKGTGLGLPLSKTIVEQHGGTIGVKPGIEHGSKFWFRVPKVVNPTLLKTVS